MDQFKRFYRIMAVIVSLCWISAAAAENITVLSSDTPFHVTSGSAKIFGSEHNNHVIIDPGTHTEIINFPGNNYIRINADSGSFTASRSGTIVTFEGTDGTVLILPASGSTQMIEFDDTTQDLVISNDRILLGGQPVPLPGETAATIRLIAPDTSLPLMSGISTTLAPEIIYTGTRPVHTSILEGPSDMQISSRTGRLTWTPGIEDEGSRVPVRISATDGDVYTSISFTVSVAQPRPVATTQTQEDDGRTRISVTEDTGNLQGMDIVLPQNVLVNGQRVSSRQIRSQPNRTGVALVDDSAVDMNAVPGHVTRLTNFFRIDPAVAEGNDWIEVVFPELTLPEGRFPDELELYVLAEATGVDGLLWLPISHGLEITDQDRIMIRIALTGSISFIGIAPQSSETINQTFQDQTPLHGPTFSQTVTVQNNQFDIAISCEKDKGFLGRTLNKIDICSLTGTINDQEVDLKFKIEGLHDSSNQFQPNWSSTVTEYDMALWLSSAIRKFEEYGLNYDTTDPDTGYAVEVKISDLDCDSDGAVFGSVSPSERRKVLHLNGFNHGQSCSFSIETDSMKSTTAHEYFHHAQSRTGDILNSDEKKTERLWAYEGTAVWFQDEVYDTLNEYSRYQFYIPHILQDGLMNGDEYERFAFFKMLQNGNSIVGCNFQTFLPAFFQEQSSSSGAQRLKNLVEAQNNPHQCYFGTDLGSEKSNTIAAALDYYSWATVIINEIALLDDNEGSFQFFDTVDDIDVSGTPDPDFIGPIQLKTLTLEPMSARVIKINDTSTDSTYDQDQRLLNLFVQAGNKIHYTVRDNIKRIVAARDSNSAGYFFPTGTGSNKIDGWYITLINDDPAQPAEVALQIFRTQEDTEFAAVRIEEPVNGTVSNNRVIRIRGTADGADIHKVKVNISETGYNVILPVTNGEFDGMITLSKGNNSISVVPMDEYDNDILTGDDSVANITVTGEESDGYGTNALIDSQMAFNLTWDQANDMDIHVWDPLNQRIWYGNEYVAYNGITYGQLDQDNMTGFGTGRSNSPEVVTYFSDMNQHPDMGGCYTIGLHYYSASGPETNLTLDILLNENSDDRRIYRRQATISQPGGWSAPIHVHCRYAGPGSEMTCSDDPGIFNGGYCEVPDDYPTSTPTSASNLFLPSKY
jgi:hypothetical protein